MAFMKPTILLFLPLASGIVLAQDAPRQEPPSPAAQQQPAPTPEPATTGTQEVPAEVVSKDAATKTIKVKVMVKKDAAAEPVEQEGTIPVDAEAATSLDSVTPGEKVKLLCRMNGGKGIAVKAINKQGPPKNETPPRP
jgi:hypothetical protein